MSAGEGNDRRGGRRRTPQRLGGALDRLVAEDAPQTLLAAVQAAWPQACGTAIAARSQPVSERGGTVTVACESGPWAQELELMGDMLRERLDGLVGAGRVEGLRFTADLSRHR